MLNGTLVGSQNIRLSWGRSPSNKQVKVLMTCCFVFISVRLMNCEFDDFSHNSRTPIRGMATIMLMGKAMMHMGMASHLRIPTCMLMERIQVILTISSSR